MVIWRLLVAQEAAQPLIRRLPPEARARVVMAILGLVIVAGALVALIVMIGRQYRRRARLGYRPIRPRPDEWAEKPLAPPADDEDNEPQP